MLEKGIIDIALVTTVTSLLRYTYKKNIIYINSHNLLYSAFSSINSCNIIIAKNIIDICYLFEQTKYLFYSKDKLL